MSNPKSHMKVKCIALLLGLLLLSCSGKVSIEMNEDVPPTFRFERNGDHVYYIPIFSVSEIHTANLNLPWSQREQEDKIVWQIEPPLGPEREIENLPPSPRVQRVFGP